MVQKSNNTQNPQKKCFTDAQRAAISCSGKGVLLSAGAGSGKTATLTEKVCRMVCDEENGTDISRMIIVTFTKLAANELRERIGKAISQKLSENPSSRYLSNQLIALESAQISTIDSFFYKIIKPYFSLLGLPPRFKVAEETSGKLLKKQVMENVIDDFFEFGDENFLKLADSISGSRDENSLPESVLSIYDKFNAKGLKAEKAVEWAKNLKEESDFFSCRHGQILKEQVLSVAEHYIQTFAYVEEKLKEHPNIEEKYAPVIKEATEYAIMLKSAADKGYNETKSALSAYSLPDFKRLNPGENNDISNFAQKIKSDFRKSVNSLLSGAFCEDAVALEKIRCHTADICIALSKIIEEFEKRYEEEKKERALVDFSDLTKYAHLLFCNPDGTPTEIAKDFSRDYDYIFIDEYQDTSNRQDEIFSAVSCNMKQRFMVGDIKQSIYSFRGAEPSVFSNYRKAWKNIEPLELENVENGKDICNMCIFMSENFRSDKNIIDYVNYVSEFIFKDTATPFKESDKLICMRHHNDNDEIFPTEVILIDTSKEKSIEKETENYDNNTEAEYVAERISKLLENGKKSNGEPLRPHDIAVLLENNTHMKKYTDALADRGIPVKDTSPNDFFGQGEILLVLCILNAIDNPLRDIYLAGAMKSPVFGFTVNDMIRLSVDKKNSPLWFCVKKYCEIGKDEELRKKCIVFCDTITKYRLLSNGMSASELLRSLYDSLSLFSLSEDNGVPKASVRRNLTELYEYARHFEEDSFGGLFGFINYVEEIMENKTEPPASANDADAVTVMTIHKSKGLEFPVCFLSECATQFQLQSAKEPVIFDPDIGIGLKLRDESGLNLCETPLRKALSEQVKKDLTYEKMRVLYVAMTRAVERLIITFKTSKPDKDIEEASRKAEFITSYERNNFKDFASMILPATLKISKTSPEAVKLLKICSCNTEFKVQNIFKKTEETREHKDMTDTYIKRMSFSYPFSYLKNIPSKVTISKLRPDFIDEEETLHIGQNKPSESNFKQHKEKKPVPNFILEKKAVKATDIGTATHVFLQFADFENLHNHGIESEIKRLCEKRFITEGMAELINKTEIEKFISSDLFSSVLASKNVRREFRFNVALPASEFTTDNTLSEKLYKSKTEIIAQGVIDLVYSDEKGRLILVDYKTDKLNEYELKNKIAAEKKLIERHKTQLCYYAKACEKMFERPVDNIMIYSLALGECIDIM